MAVSVRIRAPYSLWLIAAAFLPASASRPMPPPPSAVASGSVDLLLLAGGSPHGPALGFKTRFRNGFEVGFRHSRWQGGHAEEAGIYFLPTSVLAQARRPYFGTELFRADRNAYGLMDRSSLEARRTASGPERKPALLLVAGQEHRLGSRWAVSYEVAGGARMTRAYAGPLPPLVVQARAQLLCRVF